MTPPVRNVPTYLIGHDFSSLADAVEGLRPDRNADPAAENRGEAERPRGKIKMALTRLLGGIASTANFRWHPRVTFVHPARISFVRPGPNFGRDAAGGDCPESERSLEGVTIDLSLDGAGILIYGVDEILPQRVRLEIDGTAFDCEVRWSSRISPHVSRYGLQFHDLLN